MADDLIRHGPAGERPPAASRQSVSDMGVPRLDLDDVSSLLDALEGDDRRS